MGGWMGGWMDGWMDGWMGGSKSRVKDCLQQSKIGDFIKAHGTSSNRMVSYWLA